MYISNRQNILFKMIFCPKCILTINQAPWREGDGPKTQICACWKVEEFWYEYTVTMNVLKMIKKLVLQFCYGLTIFFHRMTGLILFQGKWCNSMRYDAKLCCAASITSAITHLVSRFACNTRVIVDASSSPPVSLMSNSCNKT